MLSLTIVAFSSLLQLSGALWIPEELRQDAALWAPEDFSPFVKRAEETCGGDDSLTQCGGDFPSTFCCGADSRCVLLNTTSTITAALCCPAGQDCQNIRTVNCDENMQNATLTPNSMLHSEPTSKLETCGDRCCPMGYKCQGGTCVGVSASDASSSTASSASTTSTSSSPTSSSGPTSSTTPTSEPASSGELIAAKKEESDGFSGKSFAAGFIPGLALGILAAALIAFFLIRKRRRNAEDDVDEKHRSGRDTLTDLSPSGFYRRPTVHGRSISEPNVDTSAVHRTDFLNFTPPSQKSGSGASGCVVRVDSPSRAPITPHSQNDDQASHQRGWFSRSPFVNQVTTPVPTQSPIPSHMKRGTLSFSISPVRALKKQRSRHSLRRESLQRQMTNSNRAGPSRPDIGRNNSQETINVAMDTPNNNIPQLPPMSYGRTPEEMMPRNCQPKEDPPFSARTWQTTTSGVSSEESTPIDTEPNYTTPTRPGRNSNVQNIGATLQSPYSPSNYGPNPQSNYNTTFLAPPTGEATAANTGKSRLSSLFPDWNRDSSWRDTRMTTWGGMMDKAGLRSSMLYAGKKNDGLATKGGDPRKWNKR